MSITNHSEVDLELQEKEGRRWLRLIILIAVLALTVFVVRSAPLVQAAPSPSDSLEQCSNESEMCDAMNPDQWVTGNLNINNSAYAEGDSVAYRAEFTRLTVGQTYMTTIDWDSTEGGLHAMDYLTSFDFSETGADPCSGLNCGSPTSTLSIADDPLVTAEGVDQADGQVFTAFGATFPTSGAVVSNTGNLCGDAVCTLSSNPSAYSTTGSYAGTSKTAVSVYFTAQSRTVVLAWGGHIASPVDWGAGNSAAGINGSSYHMRLKGFACSDVENCSTGNMDRSLSSSAVQVVGSIVITKNASEEGSTEFPFIASPTPLGNFTLIDDGTATDSHVFSGLVEPGIFTISESNVEGWDFESATCTLSNSNGGSWEANENTIEIDFRIGEIYECTFTNSLIPVVTTTTVAETTTTTTTTVPETTTTVPVTTTTVPVTTTSIPVTTTTSVVTTTTVPATTSTSSPVELQVVTPENPNGTQDAFDVLFPEEVLAEALPAAGGNSADNTLIAMALLMGGALLLAVVTSRRTRRNL